MVGGHQDHIHYLCFNRFFIYGHFFNLDLITYTSNQHVWRLFTYVRLAPIPTAMKSIYVGHLHSLLQS